MKISFEFYGTSGIMKNPFNGYEIDMERVPCTGEQICFDGANKYEVRQVVTYLQGWKSSYKVILK